MVGNLEATIPFEAALLFETALPFEAGLPSEAMSSANYRAELSDYKASS